MSSRAPAAHTWSWATRSEDGGASQPPRTEGTVVAGRYRLDRVLGVGANGEVWQARDQLLDENVAVKLVAALSPRELVKARREAVALRHARLPGVVGLRDDGRIGDDWFLVMDLVEGEGFPGRAAPQPWSQIAEVTRRLVEVLAGLHAVGVVHRDLKPGNVLVDVATQQVVVLDLGLATGQPVEEARARGHFVGTPRYAAPEQILGRQLDGRTDLYALGVMLFEALSGRVPHHGADSAMRMLARRLREPAPSLAEACPGAPEAVVRAVDGLLARDPDDRPASAWDLLSALGGRLPAPLSGELSLPAGRRATEAELWALFHGPDHFLHLREDGARALWERTGGDPGLVREELSAWIRAGLGVWEDGALRMERPALERLLRGERVGVDPLFPENQVHAALGLAFPDGDVQVVAQALGRDQASVRAQVDQLVSGGQAWWLPDGRIGTRPLRGPRSPRTHAVRRTLAAALPNTHPGRVRLLAEAEAQASELDLVVRAVLNNPDLPPGEAMAVVERGLLAARAEDDARVEQGLLVELAACALQLEAAAPLEGALYELGRGLTEGRAVEPAERLVRAVSAVLGQNPRSSRALLAEIGPLDHEDLEQWRVGLLVYLAQYDGPAIEQATLDGFEAWAAASPPRRARLLGWRGNLGYRQGRFAEAAELHEASAEGKARVGPKISSLRNAAAAWMEAGDPARSVRLADQATELARRARLPKYEALATWCSRSARHRTGERLRCQPELVRAAERFDAGAARQLALQEAIAALQSGERELGRALARAAEGQFALHGLTAGRVLASLVHHLCLDVPPPVQEAEALCAQAAGLPTAGIAVQVLGLLGQRYDRPDLLQQARATARTAGLHDPELPLELVTLGQALAWPDPDPEQP